MVAYLAGNVGPSCGYVGLCWPHVDRVEPKDPKNGNSKKNTVKRRIFWWPAAYLGAMWAHLEAMLAHLGAMLAHLGAMLAILGLCWPILELCWPILGLCWPILGLVGPSWGLCWPHLEAYLGPCWPILSHKIRKMGKNGTSTKHRKTRLFWRPGWSAAGAAAPLSYGEERNAFGNATARGPLAGFKGCRPCRRPRKILNQTLRWNPTETQKKPEIKPLRDVKLFCSILSCLYPKWNFKRL